MPMKNGGSPKRRQIAANLLLLAFVLLICLAAVELLLRVAGFKPQVADPAIYAFDDTLGWVGKPNLVAHLLRGQDTIRYEINRWGFRDDQPIPWPAAQNRRRLMLLGDSYAMGYEIDKEARVSELLEKSDSTLLAYNFGIMGYSTDQELLVFKKYGPEIHPQIVTLFFCVNDIYYSEQAQANNHPKPLFRLQPDDSLQLINAPLPPPSAVSRMWNWLATRLVIGKTVAQGLARLREALGMQNRPSRNEGWQVGREGGREDQLLRASTEHVSNLTYYLLRDLRDESLRLGARLYIFMCPSSARWTETRDESPEGIKLALSWCEKLNVPAVDLFPLLRKDYLDNKQDLYIYDKMHWNERANRVIADSVMKTIQKPFAASADTSN